MILAIRHFTTFLAEQPSSAAAATAEPSTSWQTITVAAVRCSAWFGSSRAFKIRDRNHTRALSTPTNETKPGEKILLAPREICEIAIEQVIWILEPHKRFERLPSTCRALEHDPFALCPRAG